MALPELLAALEAEAVAEVRALRARAEERAEALRAAARAAAAERRERALAAEGALGAGDDELHAARASAAGRIGELAARAELLARAHAACRAAAAAAELAAPPELSRRLLRAALSCVPAAEEARVRCAPELRAAVGAAGEAGLAVETVAGEPFALVSGPWRVELGLAALLDSRWGELAPRVLRALLSPAEVSP